MIKRYCDCCDNEIVDSNRVDSEHWRLIGEIKKKGKIILKVEVITAKGSTWNDGEFCKYCIIDAINTADDRPRAE